MRKLALLIYIMVGAAGEAPACGWDVLRATLVELINSGHFKVEYIRGGAAPEVSAITINRMYQRLSPDNGVLLVSLPTPITGHEAWTARLRESGVTIDWNTKASFTFRIIRTKTSPDNLPRFH